MRITIVLLVLVFFASFTHVVNAAEVQSVVDLAYGTEEKQKLDLFLPPETKNFPVLLFVHGGGYQKGDRKEGETLGRTFAARGIGVAVISYRLYPPVKHPGQIQDVAQAFAWVKKNIAKHGGNPARVFVSGHSAGAHLASLLATDANYLKAENLQLKDIAGVVAISGGYRILPIRQDVFGSQEAMDQASPLAHLSSGHPPFLIVYGDGDTPERHALSKEFQEALRKAGGVAELLEVKERTHKELFEKIGAGDATTEAAIAFITKKST